MEALVGREGVGERVKFEEQLIVTVCGPELISPAAHDGRFVA